VPAGDSYILPTLTGVMSTGFWPVFRPRFAMSHVNIANVCEGTRLAAQKGRGGQTYFLLDKEQPSDGQAFMLRLAATQARSAPAAACIADQHLRSSRHISDPTSRLTLRSCCPTWREPIMHPRALQTWAVSEARSQ